MFNLEQSIAELRRKMLAVGIKTPEPLEELEMQLRQLREELAQHTKTELEERKTSGSAGKKAGTLDCRDGTINIFELEQSIADWRTQMLAVGVKTPVPLEELEIHLREEIEQQVKSGLSEQDAFNSAVQKIGQANVIQNEFQKRTPGPRISLVFLALSLCFAVASICGLSFVHSSQPFIKTCGLLVFVGSIAGMTGNCIFCGTIYFSRRKSRC
jgi:hypothetical protein